MNIHSNIRRLAAIAVVALVLCPAAVWARKASRIVEEHGVIASLDPAAHEMTITNQKTRAAERVTWNKHTKFIEHGKSANATVLKEGMAVDLTYTITAGARTLRNVKLAPASPATHVPSSDGSSAETP